MLPRKSIMLAAAATMLWLGDIHAQSTPAPKISTIAPAGGQVGSSFELTVTGTDMDKAEGLHFSFPGAKSEAVGTSAKAPEAEMRKKGGGGRGMGGGPQLSQKFKVTLPAQVPLGIHDVRLVTKGGLSNPRAFVVSDMKEIAEQEPNDNVDKAQKVDLNTSISGVVANPTDVDYYQFTGRKGQRVVISCLTSSIDSKLPVQIEVYSATDKFLGSNRGYQNNDALVDVTLPEDGNYFVRLHAFTYTLGGPDYFYRLTISTAPWIDAVVPAVVEAGKESKVTVYGRNLPKGVADSAAVVEGKTLEKLVVTVKPSADAKATQRLAYNGYVMPNAAALDGFALQLKNDSGTSNPYLIGFAHGPVAVDNEKNGTPATAQPVQVPGAVGGRLQKKGDRDYYAFTAKKGQVVHIELFSDRLGAPTDMYFELFTLKDGKQALVSKQDDTPDTYGNQFPSPTYDPSSYRFVAPADGTYYVLVTSTEVYSQFGPRHVYTLTFSPDEPDFRLIAMPVNNQGPESVTLGQASHQAYSLMIARLRGFTGDITVSSEQLLPGVTMKPQVVAGNQKQAAFVVSAAPEAPPAAGAIKLLGMAVINGKKVIREVRGATITWGIGQQQQNVPMIARLDRELVLAVRDKASYRVNVDKDTISILQGERLTVPVKVAYGEYKGPVSLVALALPTGMVMQPVTVNPGKEAVQINFDSKTTVLPGNYTLILRGQTQDPKAKPATKPGGPANFVQAAPPITVTIVPKQLAKLAGPNNLKVAAGKDVELVIRLNRQFDFDGTFKVEVVLPPGAKAVSVDPVTVKSGEEEAKLIVRALAGANPGQLPALTVRATAMFNNAVPVVHETKVNVVVTK